MRHRALKKLTSDICILLKQIIISQVMSNVEITPAQKFKKKQ